MKQYKKHLVKVDLSPFMQDLIDTGCYGNQCRMANILGLQQSEVSRAISGLRVSKKSRVFKKIMREWYIIFDKEV